jgi:hypothetical protein
MATAKLFAQTGTAEAQIEVIEPAATVVENGPASFPTDPSTRQRGKTI